MDLYPLIETMLMDFNLEDLDSGSSYLYSEFLTHFEAHATLPELTEEVDVMAQDENRIQLILEEVTFQQIGEVSKFWINLGEVLEDARQLECYVRGPSGTRYPVFVARNPAFGQPTQLQCIWKPMESGVHKAVAFLGEEPLRGSPGLTYVDLKDGENDVLIVDSNVQFFKKTIIPRQLRYTDSN